MPKGTDTGYMDVITNYSNTTNNYTIQTIQMPARQQIVDFNALTLYNFQNYVLTNLYSDFSCDFTNVGLIDL